MIRYLLFFLLIPCLFAADKISSHSTNLVQMKQQYIDLSKEILKLNTRMEFKSVADKSKELLSLGKSIASEYSLKNPECKNYLNAVLDQTPKMLTSTLDEVEKNYHQGSKLPAIENSKCKTAKELVVHPATVLLLSDIDVKTFDQEKIASELEEAIQQAQVLN